jgi:hypothetical protein
MAETLLAKNINQTYPSLLKTSTNSALAGDIITDGIGTQSAFFLGKSGSISKFDGALSVAQNFLASNSITTKQNLCVCGSATIDNNIIVSGNTNINGITATNFKFGGGGAFDAGITFNNTISVAGVATLTNTNIGGELTVTGGISAGGDIVAFHSSDSRLKDNLIPINSQNYVENLTGFEFDWNERSKRSGKGKGIIAQDLYKIDKTLVHETNEGYLAVDYIGLIPVLIEEVKRLSKEIEELKKIN